MSPFSDLFAPPPPRILTDDDVEIAVLDLIREAKEYVVLVSPYHQHWFHLKRALKEAIGQGVEVTVGYRTKDSSYRSREGTEDVDELAGLGATVVAVPNLHAKIYMNESTALVASMNLTEWSTKNSREICVRIDGRERSELEDYINALLDDGTPNRTAPAPHRGRTARGWCIRCGKDIAFNTKEPLCPADRKVWNKPQYRNPDYPEKHCHRCGREHSTTFAKPLCLPCYRESPSASP